MKITPLLLSLLAVCALSGCVNDTTNTPAATPETDTAAVVPVPTPDSDMLFEEIPDEEELPADGLAVPDSTPATENNSDADLTNGAVDSGMTDPPAGTDAGALTPDASSLTQDGTSDWSMLENNVKNTATKEQGVEDAIVLVSGDNRCLVALKLKQGETLDTAAADNIKNAVGTDYTVKITTDPADYSKAEAMKPTDEKPFDDNAFTRLYEDIKAAL